MGRSRLTSALAPSQLDRTDRLLLGSCAGIWLVALGVGVAAAVALVNLGSNSAGSAGDGGTPWLLYTVIGISAAVIIAAVPLLLRARREALSETPPAERAAHPPATDRAQAPGVEAPTEKLSTLGAQERVPYAAPRAVRTQEAPGPVAAAVDRLWLRCAVAIAAAIGVAMVAVGVGTYLMAVDSTIAAWVFFVLAVLIALAMPAVPWFYLKELRGLLDQQAA